MVDSDSHDNLSVSRQALGLCSLPANWYGYILLIRIASLMSTSGGPQE